MTTTPTKQHSHHTTDQPYYRRGLFGGTAELNNALVVTAARSVTTIGGDGVLDFAIRLRNHLGAEGYIHIDNLARDLGASPEQIQPVLDRLVDAGALCRSAERYASAVLIAAARAGNQVSDDVIAKRFSTTHVSLVARPGSHLAATIAQAAAELGIQVQMTTKVDCEADLKVVVANSFHDKHLFNANRIALADATPWLPVIAYDSDTAWVGPFVVPHQSACLTCLQLRRSANFSDDVFRPELLKIEPVDDPAPETGPNPVHYLQAGIVANFLMERVGLHDYAPSAAPGGITSIRINDSGLSMEYRRIFRVPRCPSCSPVADTGFPQVWFHAPAREGER
ncbi:MAG: TOMM precursor leader peptide-binding protein [Propionibacteriaceae bacterium]|nr:TOMM precursor leader peptide-binding protein [Propionibacteriaceae bacterium]